MPKHRTSFGFPLSLQIAIGTQSIFSGGAVGRGEQSFQLWAQAHKGLRSPEQVPISASVASLLCDPGQVATPFCASHICAIGIKAFHGQSFQVRSEKPTESCTDVLYSGTHLGALTFAKTVKHHSGAAAPSTGLNSLLNRGSTGPDRKQGFSSSAWSARKSAPLRLL